MTPEILERKQAQFLALAARAFEQMFGSDGQNGLVTFAEREERACEATDGLARWRMAEHVTQDRTGAGDAVLWRRADDRVVAAARAADWSESGASACYG
jgi:hypothetical protein